MVKLSRITTIKTFRQKSFSIFTQYTLGLFVWVLMCFFSGTLLAQEGITYKHYTTDDGLPHSIIYSFFQDQKGYLWAGSDDGLARFDGTEWKVYTEKDGLTSPYPIEMEEASDGSLWIATWRGGMCRMIKDTIIPVNAINGHDKLNGLGIVSDQTVAAWDFTGLYFFESKGENQWVCRGDQHLYGIQNNAGVIEHAFLTESPGKAGARFANIDYFVNSNRKLFVFGELPFVLEYVDDNTLIPRYENEVKTDTIFGLFEDQDQGVWLGGKEKISYVSANGTKKVYQDNLPNERIYFLNVVSDQYVYFITGSSRYKNRIAYRYDLQTGDLINLSDLLALTTPPSQIYQDNEHNLWLSTHGDGVFCLFNRPFRQFTSQSGLKNPFIYTIEKGPQGRMWVGTKDGLSIYENQQFKSLELSAGGSSTNRLLTVVDILFRDENPNEAWLGGTYPSLHITNLETLQRKTFTVTGERLMISDQGRKLSIPFGVEGVLYSDQLIDMWSEQGEYHLGKYQYMLNGKFCMNKEHGSGNRRLYWLMPDKEFCFYDEQLKKHQVLDHLDIIDLNAVYEDALNNLWVASEQGLIKIAYHGDTYSFERAFTTKDGLISNRCRTLLMDKNGLLWIGTPKGLCYFDGSSFQAYNSRIGLLTDDVNCLAMDDNSNLWIGGSKGISVLNVAYPPKKDDAPTIHLEEIRINGAVHHNVDQKMEFPHDVALRFFFKAITYTYPEKIQYEYKINHGDWIMTKDLSIAFFASKPRDYQLQVRAKKFNSDWSEPLVLDFEVVAPWWRRGWAMVGFMVLVSSLISSFFIIRSKQQKLKEAERIQTNKLFAELELKALQAQMNPHFIFNALNSIQSFVLENDERLANKYLTKFSKLMRLSLEASKAKYITVDQEIKLLDSYMQLEQLRFGGQFRFSLEISPELNPHELKIPGMIIQPFVENAINHGLLYKEYEKGNLNVVFSLDQNQLLCVVDDDGIGRTRAMEIQQKMKKSHKSRAMQIIEERLEAIGMIDGIEIAIQVVDKIGANNQPAGTRVEIRFPIDTHKPTT